MAASKSIRSRGKVPFSRYFQSFSNGDYVALVSYEGPRLPFPNRMMGRTGVVVGKRGFSYIVEVKDLNLKKTIIAHPLYLKKISVTQK